MLLSWSDIFLLANSFTLVKNYDDGINKTTFMNWIFNRERFILLVNKNASYKVPRHTLANTLYIQQQ